MPRDRAYWEAKLTTAREAVPKLEGWLMGPWHEHPRRGAPNHSAALWAWERDQRARRRWQRKLTMLRETKIPYYEARVWALTPTAWQRLME